MEKFLKEMMKKGKKMGEMSDIEQKASLKVLEDLKGNAEDAMSSKLSLKAKSKEEAKGLLDKAEDVVENMPEESEMEDESEEDESEMEEDCDEDMMMASEELESKVRDYSDLSMDEIERELERLQKLKMKKVESDSFSIA